MKLPRKHEPFVFNPNVRSLQSVYDKSRNRLAESKEMPNLKLIHFHSLRRFFADQTYKKTRFNTRKVQKQLGHKHLSSTEQYFGDFEEESCPYETLRAHSLDEYEELRRLGYELDFQDIDENGKKVWMMSRLA